MVVTLILLNYTTNSMILSTNLLVERRTGQNIFHIISLMIFAIVMVAYDDIPVGSARFKKYDDECGEGKSIDAKALQTTTGIVGEGYKEIGISLSDFAIW